MLLNNIKVIENSIEEKRLLFKELNFDKKINILFGGNGVGKSTLLKGIINKSLDFKIDKDVEIMSFINSQDNINVSKSRDISSTRDFIKTVNSNLYSEGQTIVHWLLSFIYDVEEKLKQGGKVLVCIDEMDSGLSVENINMFLHLITDIIREYPNNAQFIISTNHYHYIYVFKKVINMYTGELIDIKSYEEYFELLNNGINLMQQKGRNFDFLDVY